MTALFSHGNGKKIDGQIGVIYRLNNTEKIDLAKNLEQFYYFVSVPKSDNAICLVKNILTKAIHPALENFKDYGDCSNEQKEQFLYGSNNFINFLNSKLNISFNFFPYSLIQFFHSGTHDALMESVIKFDYDFYLFKGQLLVDFQIKASAKKRDVVAKIETTFTRWLNQMRVVITQGHQLAKENADHGPLKELEYWKLILSKFSYVEEFTRTRVFRNYHYCLKLTKSKLIKVRKL
jgi:dynein heavy chain